jgi:MFS transporter, DHA2 family, multidrug resistance protein
VLVPGGVGNLISLVIAGRVVARMDQRILVALGCMLNGIALYWMSHLTLGVDYWSLVWPRFAQGFGMGFLFLPLTTLSISSIPKARLPNATAAFNLIRNMGGSTEVAMATTLLVRPSQYHQATLVGHVDVWDPETTATLTRWADVFTAQGSDPFTARSRATVMLYRDTVARRRCWPTWTSSGCSRPSSSYCWCSSRSCAAFTRPHRRRGPSASRGCASPAAKRPHGLAAVE